MPSREKHSGLWGNARWIFVRNDAAAGDHALESDQFVFLQALQQADGDRMADRPALTQFYPGVQSDTEVVLDHFGFLAMDHRAHLVDDISLEISEFLNAHLAPV